MTRSDLPAVYQEQLARLSAGEWRERKEAVETLRKLVEIDRRDEARMRALAESLLDGLLSKEALDGRAACHEVLAAVGEIAVPSLLSRLQTDAPSLRLLVDLLGEIGSEEHAEQLAQIATDSDADVNLRASAATALGRVGGEGAARVLIGLLQDFSGPSSPAPQVRSDAGGSIDAGTGNGESTPEMMRNHVLEALRLAGVAVPVSALADAVASKFTRKAAAGVLGSSDDPAAVGVLLPLLDDRMPAVRAEAAQSLVHLDARLREQDRAGVVRTALRQAAPSLIEGLHELIGHHERPVRAAAIRLAGLAGDAAALGRVLEVMDDPLLQEEALDMVAELGPKAARALDDAQRAGVPVRREHLLRLIGAIDPEHVGEDLRRVLVQGLHEADEDAAVAAAEALEAAGGSHSLSDLYRAMAEPGRLGEAAADAIGAVVHRTGADHELDAILGTNWPQEGELARNLCRVIGMVGSQRYAPHLVSMLGSTDVGVRVAAAQALGNLRGEHEGASALSFALTDEEPQVRAAACRSLGQLGVPQSVQPLLSATSDASPLVRAAAVQALVAVDNPVSLSRLRAVIAEDPVPAVVVQAIAGLGRSRLDQDLTMLMSLCTSKDWEVVKAAARALEHFEQHRATAALLGLLGHDRWDVRWAAAEVLAKRGDNTALPSLRQARKAEEDALVGQVLEDAIAKLERTG